jgi:Skp family chaperone for outer membrane proteins
MTTARRSAKAAISREKRAASEEIKRGVKHLEKSIGEIQKGLRKAERQIEADARARVRALRKDARAQLTALKGRHREVARILEKVSAAAEGSWRQVKRSADAILAEAVDGAASLVKRLKNALPR